MNIGIYIFVHVILIYLYIFRRFVFAHTYVTSNWIFKKDTCVHTRMNSHVQYSMCICAYVQYVHMYVDVICTCHMYMDVKYVQTCTLYKSMFNAIISKSIHICIWVFIKANWVAFFYEEKI